MQTNFYLKSVLWKIITLPPPQIVITPTWIRNEYLTCENNEICCNHHLQVRKYLQAAKIYCRSVAVSVDVMSKICKDERIMQMITYCCPLTREDRQHISLAIRPYMQERHLEIYATKCAVEIILHKSLRRRWTTIFWFVWTK